jgi:NAD(P)-dependent dehydrogenase (short-subunit alcohol dehydrogenase family)
MTPHQGRTVDGFETQFGTNHLSHFLLFNLLQPALLAGAARGLASRVIVLSSVGHRFAEADFADVNWKRRDYDGMAAYSASKTANLWTANEIERRFGSQGIHAWSIQPGAVTTSLGQNLSEQEQQAIMSDEYLVKVTKNPAQGAATSVWGAVAQALDGRGGKYLENCQVAQPWDPKSGQWTPGYGIHAYDETGATKLWESSLKWTGLEKS